jgi:hypothetical protein
MSYSDSDNNRFKLDQVYQSKEVLMHLTIFFLIW